MAVLSLLNSVLALCAATVLVLREIGTDDGKAVQKRACFVISLALCSFRMEH